MRARIILALLSSLAMRLDAQVADPRWSAGLTWQAPFPVEKSLGIYVSRRVVSATTVATSIEGATYIGVGKYAGFVCLARSSGSCGGSSTRQVVELLLTARPRHDARMLAVGWSPVIGVGPYLARAVAPDNDAAWSSKLGVVTHAGLALRVNDTCFELAVRRYLGSAHYDAPMALRVALGFVWH